jgi:excisionase family DNA binding protein
MEPLLLKMEDAAAVLGISRSKAYELAAAGRLETVRIGASRRVTREALERFVEHLADTAA